MDDARHKELQEMLKTAKEKLDYACECWSAGKIEEAEESHHKGMAMIDYVVNEEKKEHELLVKE